MVMKRRIRLSVLQKQIRLEGLISNDSPIAKGLIGRSKGDEVENHDTWWRNVGCHS